jgi:hypothetical protein
MAPWSLKLEDAVGRVLERNGIRRVGVHLAREVGVRELGTEVDSIVYVVVRVELGGFHLDESPVRGKHSTPTPTARMDYVAEKTTPPVKPLGGNFL